MASIRRFIQAVRRYYKTGDVGDVAFLKINLFKSGVNPAIKDQLQELAGYYPKIDLEQLSQLPAGTLGYEYAQHMRKNGIQPLAISPDLQEEADRNPFALRYVVTHDIFHVLLGFDTSYAGEIGVYAFVVAQNYSKLLNIFHPLAMLLYPVVEPMRIRETRAYFRRGAALGKQAQCLLTYRFEENWERAIADLRSELGLLLDEPAAHTVIKSQQQNTVAV